MDKPIVLTMYESLLGHQLIRDIQVHGKSLPCTKLTIEETPNGLPILTLQIAMRHVHIDFDYERPEE